MRAAHGSVVAPHRRWISQRVLFPCPPLQHTSRVSTKGFLTARHRNHGRPHWGREAKPRMKNGFAVCCPPCFKGDLLFPKQPILSVASVPPCHRRWVFANNNGWRRGGVDPYGPRALVASEVWAGELRLRGREAEGFAAAETEPAPAGLCPWWGRRSSTPLSLCVYVCARTHTHARARTQVQVTSHRVQCIALIPV